MYIEAYGKEMYIERRRAMLSVCRYSPSPSDCVSVWKGGYVKGNSISLPVIQTALLVSLSHTQTKRACLRITLWQRPVVFSGTVCAQQTLRCVTVGGASSHARSMLWFLLFSRLLWCSLPFRATAPCWIQRAEKSRGPNTVTGTEANATLRSNIPTINKSTGKYTA